MKAHVWSTAVLAVLLGAAAASSARAGEGDPPPQVQLNARPTLSEKKVRLVGGIAGRKGADILPTTGAPGEILRVGVSLSCINAWGNEQDYKVNWPASLMFSDSSRSCPFAFGK